MSSDPSTTIATIPAELLAAHGFVRGAASVSSYRCTDPGAQKIPTSGITYSRARKLELGIAAGLLKRIHNDEALEPIRVSRRPAAYEFTLIDGLHRLLVSMAVGFTSIPAVLITYEEASQIGFQ